MGHFRALHALHICMGKRHLDALAQPLFSSQKAALDDGS